MARPRAIQGEVEKRLLYALGNGAPIRIACGYAGIGERTYYEECDRNPQFAQQATRARDQAATDALAQIKLAGHEDWRAAAKFIELSHPKDFNVQRHELAGSEGGPLKITLDFGGAAVPAVTEPAHSEKESYQTETRNQAVLK